MDINNSILSFGDYFLLTLKTGGKKVLPLLLTLVISFAAMIVVFLICMIPVVLALANNLPFDILQDINALEYYIYSGEIFYELIPVLPALAVSFILMGFFSSIIQCFQIAMIYTITDSSVCDDKRSFGKMFSYALKRTFPILGTDIVLSLIYSAISTVFIIAAIAIAVAMGIDISSVMYYEDISAQMQLGVFTIICFVLLLIMLVFIILFALIYSMSIFARAKYKFSGVSSLRYSRLLTKGKRGKIFGNLLLIVLISMLIAGLLSYASSNAAYYGIPFIPFIIQLVLTFIGMLVSVFWAVMFINFDNVKGPDIISSRFAKAVNIKDVYFQSGDTAQDYTYNQNNAQQANVPVQNSAVDEQNEPAVVQRSEQADIQPVDTQTEGNSQDTDQPSQEPSNTDDKDKTE